MSVDSRPSAWTPLTAAGSVFHDAEPAGLSQAWLVTRVVDSHAAGAAMSADIRRPGVSATVTPAVVVNTAAGLGDDPDAVPSPPLYGKESVRTDEVRTWDERLILRRSRCRSKSQMGGT